MTAELQIFLLLPAMAYGITFGPSNHVAEKLATPYLLRDYYGQVGLVIHSAARVNNLKGWSTTMLYSKCMHCPFVPMILSRVFVSFFSLSGYLNPALTCAWMSLRRSSHLRKVPYFHRLRIILYWLMVPTFHAKTHIGIPDTCQSRTGRLVNMFQSGNVLF